MQTGPATAARTARNLLQNFRPERPLGLPGLTYPGQPVGGYIEPARYKYRNQTQIQPLCTTMLYKLLMHYLKNRFIIQSSPTPNLNISTLEVYRWGVLSFASPVCTIDRAVKYSPEMKQGMTLVRTCTGQNVYGLVKTCTGPGQNVYNMIYD